MRVSPTQLSVLRMIPIAKRVARAGGGRLAVYRLLNSSRGWNTHLTPVDDVQWALAELTELWGDDLPICLVGHSLGGRAALLAGTNPAVTAVVALNPYLYPQDGHSDLTGRRVLLVHGTEDRIARIEVAEQVAGLLARRTAVTLLRVLGGKHAMLRRHRVFDSLAAEFAASSLLGRPARGLLAGWETGTKDV